MSDQKLLPCPFCGSSNVDPAGWTSTGRGGPMCDNCEGSAPTVKLWNTRAAQLTNDNCDSAIPVGE